MIRLPFSFLHELIVQLLTIVHKWVVCYEQPHQLF